MDDRTPAQIIEDLEPLLATYARNNAYGSDEEEDIYQDAVLFLLEKNCFRDRAEGKELGYFTSRCLRNWMSNRKDSIRRRSKYIIYSSASPRTGGLIDNTLYGGSGVLNVEFVYGRSVSVESQALEQESLQDAETAYDGVLDFVATLPDLKRRICELLMEDPSEEVLGEYTRRPSKWTHAMLAKVVGCSRPTIDRAMWDLDIQFASLMSQ